MIILIDNYDSSFIEGFVTTNISATKTFFKKFNFQVGLSNNLIDYTPTTLPKQNCAILWYKLMDTFVLRCTWW